MRMHCHIGCIDMVYIQSVSSSVLWDYYFVRKPYCTGCIDMVYLQYVSSDVLWDYYSVRMNFHIDCINMGYPSMCPQMYCKKTLCWEWLTTLIALIWFLHYVWYLMLYKVSFLCKAIFYINCIYRFSPGLNNLTLELILLESTSHYLYYSLLLHHYN